MNKGLMKNLVKTSTTYKERRGRDDRAIFEAFLYGVFNEKNMNDIVIQHLSLLAEVLAEKRRVDLIDDITFANSNAAS